MPFIDRRSPITPANMRNADVAQRMTEHVIPMQQARMNSAFRVQGVQAVLYNRLSQGIVCSCKSKDQHVLGRLDTGDVVGSANRAQTNTQFGVGSYNPMSPDAEFDDDNFQSNPTSPNNPLSQWMGDVIKAGHERDGANLILDVSANSEAGQFSPDLDNIFSVFDPGTMGLTDVSCPVCFGSGYVGGYSQFRGWRHVVAAPQIVDTAATFDLTTSPLALRPGTHTFMVVLPSGAVVIDVFRALNGDKVIGAQIKIDGTDTAQKPVLQWFDGKPHTIQVVASDPMTHFEIQAGTSTESVFFEFPKRTKSADISLLERQEPFQIILSPDVPQLDTLDVISESQTGKFLIVQNVNDWNTRNQQMLGWECTVRTAQPAELWRILPQRRHVSWQKTAVPAHPSKANQVGGLSAGRDQGFSY